MVWIILILAGVVSARRFFYEAGGSGLMKSFDTGSLFPSGSLEDAEEMFYGFRGRNSG